MTKGLQGAFGLVVPVCYWLVFRSSSFQSSSFQSSSFQSSSFQKKAVQTNSFWRILGYNLFLLAIPTAIYTVLFLCDKAAYASFAAYFQARLVTAFDGSTDTTSSHFYLLIELAAQLLPVAACSVLIIFFMRKKLPYSLFVLEKKQQKTGLFFLLIGLAGSLPLVVTLQQRSFYVTTAIPYFTLLFCSIVSPSVFFFIENLDGKNKQFQLFKGGVYALFLVSIIVFITSIGKVKRNNDLVYDAHLVEKTALRGTIVSTPSNYLFDYELQAYLARYGYISLDVYSKNRPYFLIKKGEEKSIPAHYTRLNLPTKAIDIYQANF
jgi:hypothetical protein